MFPLCPVVPMYHANIGISLALHQYWTDFHQTEGGNRYHQQVEWLDFRQNRTRDKAAGTTKNSNRRQANADAIAVIISR